MRIEYDHGQRLTQNTHEMTFLEAEISRYEQLAKQHYSPDSITQTLTEAQREEQLCKSLDHLACERRKLETIIDVQTKLDKYRSEGLKVVDSSITTDERDNLIQAMTTEAHHPTATLEKHMLADGKPKPSPKHTAHHIVPGKGKLPDVTYRARIHIHGFGIRINDPINGVYLVSKDSDTPHWSMPNSRGHKKYHTHHYEQWVSRRITRTTGHAQVKTNLQVIARILQNNPPEAIKDKF